MIYKEEKKSLKKYGNPPPFPIIWTEMISIMLG